MLGSVRLVQVVIMTDRRDFVKALRALARTHGVTQVRDYAAKEKVMQMVKTSLHMVHIPSRSPDLKPNRKTLGIPPEETEEYGSE